MQKISKVIAGQNESATNSTSSPEKPTSEKLPDKWILAIFKKFQALYLQRWDAAIDGIEAFAADEWGKTLYGLDGEQIKHGLENLPDDWPPTAMQFRKLCIDKPAAAYHKPYVEIEQQKARPEVAERELAKMRNKLK